jgi:hypothetical protein
MTMALPASTSGIGAEPLAPLPQPIELAHEYQYVLYDEIQSTFFSATSDCVDFSEGMLCWVLKSKGQHKSNSSKKKKAGQMDISVEGGSVECNSNTASSSSVEASSLRTELFLRARVVRSEEEDDRILVRYPKGSTYRVRRSHLIPVLEGGKIQQPIVLVIPETPDYRRAAVVHTCQGDDFLEIGCDFGPATHRVQRALSDIGHVPLHVTDTQSSDNEAVEQETSDDVTERVTCLGIDKSPQSIDIAKERFPDCHFSLEDALTDSGTIKLRTLCQEKLIRGFPSVVAVDINGNRELPGVLQCLNNIMNPGSDVELGKNWELPRLIIVKARSLYAEVQNRRKLLVDTKIDSSRE